MPAESLMALSMRAAIRMAPRITSVGDLQPSLALPILSKITSPAQLYEVEQSSPQLIGHIDELWLAFLKRDIPNYESRPHRPANPASWYKVYKKLKKQADAEANAGRDALKAALQGIKETREANVAVFVAKKEDLPRGGRPGSGRRKTHSDYAIGKAGSKSAQKPTLFDKIRKEKAEAKAARHKRPAVAAPAAAAVANPVQGIIEERKRLEAERRRERERTAAAAAAAAAAVAATSVRGRDRTPQAAHSAARKRSADEAGLAADEVDCLFDDKQLVSGDNDDDDDNDDVQAKAPVKRVKLRADAATAAPAPATTGNARGHGTRPDTLNRRRTPAGTPSPPPPRRRASSASSASSSSPRPPRSRTSPADAEIAKREANAATSYNAPVKRTVKKRPAASLFCAPSRR